MPVSSHIRGGLNQPFPEVDGTTEGLTGVLGLADVVLEVTQRAMALGQPVRSRASLGWACTNRSRSVIASRKEVMAPFASPVSYRRLPTLIRLSARAC